MTYTVVYVADCEGCKTNQTLTYFQSSTPPAIEAVGTEAMDGPCGLCETPVKYTLVGVTVDGYKVVSDTDDDD